MNYPQIYQEIKPPLYTERSLLILLTVVGAAFGFALSCVLGGPASDEGYHAPQIWHYFNGGTEYADNLTMPPTYHYIVAFIVRQIGYFNYYMLRFSSMSVALCTLPLFYAMAARYQPEGISLRALQLFFAPLIFPYYFLIYTDIWALLAIGLTLYCGLQRRYLLAGFCGLLAICIRQDSAVWVGLAFLLVCSEGIPLQKHLDYRRLAKNVLLHAMPLGIALVLFVLFVFWNGGVALGEKNMHDLSAFNITNLYVFLFCAWLLFLPLNIQQLPSIWKVMQKFWVQIALLVGFLFYMGTVSNPHGYNNTHFGFFLHNGLLYLLMTYPPIRILMYLPIAWMAMSLCLMTYPENRFRWLLLVIPLSVISHPMVEPRYYFPAYMLINIWRPQMSLKVEITTLAVYAVLAAYIMLGTVKGWFFL